MSNKYSLIVIASLISVIAGCTNTFNPLDDYEALEPATILKSPAPIVPSDQTNRGQYLVEILGCSTCHTDGALTGEPNLDRRLAGSSIGIAYTSPFADKPPGVIYPPNLTPDPQTGIGSWSTEQLVSMIKTGINRHGARQLPVMPWPAYAKLSEPDAEAIAAYLLSLRPVIHQVPTHVLPGNKTRSPYVHFGVYRSK